MSDDEIALLRASAINCGGDARPVAVTVSSAAYSCCGRGWQRRDGYEQTYVGWVDNLHEPDGMAQGAFMLYGVGLGTVAFTLAVVFAEVELVEST